MLSEFQVALKAEPLQTFDPNAFAQVNLRDMLKRAFLLNSHRLPQQLFQFHNFVQQILELQQYLPRDMWQKLQNLVMLHKWFQQVEHQGFAQ